MKKTFIFLASIAVVLVILYLYKGYPLVMNSHQQEVINLPNSEAISFNPIESLDFKLGNNKAYLLLSREDTKELPKEMRRRKLLECVDNATLEDLRKVFLFAKSNGDMTTCESGIFIYKDSKLVFHSAFFLTDSIVGIQNSIVGWAEAANKDKLLKIFLRFKAVNTPVVKL